MYLVQEKNWMALLLNWMNQYDRPKVQVEAMLSLTTITDLCQQEFYENPSSMGGEQSPFANGLESIHNSFKRQGMMGKTPSRMDPMTSHKINVTDKVKSIIDQSKEIYDKIPNKNENTPTLKSFQNLIQHVTSNPRSYIPDDLHQQVSDHDQKLNQVFNSSDSKSINEQSVPMVDTIRMDSITKDEIDQFSRYMLPSNFLDISQQSSGLPPLHKMASMLQNLPQLSTNQIPLGGNYTQPLSSSSINLLVRHPEAIPSFISLMTSPDKDVCENAMWVIGNIASGDSPSMTGNGGGSNLIGDAKTSNISAKDIILAAGAMRPLLRCMEKFQDTLSLQRIGSWVISTLVETKVAPGRKGLDHNSRVDDIDLDELLLTLRRLISLDDHDILSYACWSLSHLCDGPASCIMAVVTKKSTGGFVPRLIELLHHSNWRVTKPALRTIGNIVCAEYDDDEMTNANEDSSFLTDFTEVILEFNAIPTLKDLITHSNREIQKEACWTLSNIAAGTVDQIQAVIDSGAVIPLVKLVNDVNTDQEVRSEACWVVLNATSCGSDSQIDTLVNQGCVSVLGLLLEETNMVTMALEGLERVLHIEEAREKAYIKDGRKGCQPEAIVTAYLIEKALTKKHSSAVNKRAQKIWNDHFVSCALCHKAYSKHRGCDAKFCDECKCYVCCNCSCEVYHLSYQQELWADDTEQSNDNKSKKNKNKKKKDKKKNKTKNQDLKEEVNDAEILLPTVDSLGENIHDIIAINSKEEESKIYSDMPSIESDEESVEELRDPEIDKEYPFIDFSLYLQQTGSIIALARLMDAIDEGTVAAEDFRVLQ